LTALKRMDSIYQKLLLVMRGEQFIGLVSIGDIQRSIIRNEPLETPVSKIIRKNLRIAFPDQPLEEIKEEMFKNRMELIPIVDHDHKLVNVIFWEDIFNLELRKDDRIINIPVVIMAGGQGSRLKPITNVIPKPLLPLKNKPIIEDIIDKFSELGVKEFILSVNYKAELISFYFDQIIDGKDYSIKYIHEEKPLGTAGSLKLLEGQISTTFFVTNCDILIQQDYRDVLDYHLENKNELTLVSSLKSYSIPYGTLKVGANGQLIELNEKPTISYFINAGMYLLEPHLFNDIPSNTFFNITDLIQVIQKRNGKIGVFPVSEGSLTDIGNWNDYIRNFI